MGVERPGDAWHRVAASWLTAFLDYPSAVHESGVGFWSAVTGYALSPVRGRAGEFATLVPPDGDDYLRVQRVGDPAPRIHLDLHVAEPERAAEVVGRLGARRVAGPADGVMVFATPGGLTCCLVRDPASRVAPSPRAHPSGRRSVVYQVCLDIPSDSYDAETAFWGALLGGPAQVLARRPEFARLGAVRRGGPRRWALGVLLQRLGEPTGPVRAHLDLGTTDRAAEVADHVALGARVEREEEFWTVLRDPGGLRYCVTDRDPDTRRLVPARGTTVTP